MLSCCTYACNGKRPLPTGKADGVRFEEKPFHSLASLLTVSDAESAFQPLGSARTFRTPSRSATKMKMPAPSKEAKDAKSLSSSPVDATRDLALIDSVPKETVNALVAGVALLAFVAPAAAAGAMPFWFAPLKNGLNLIAFTTELAFLSRVVLSWFPRVRLNVLPWVVLYEPTEPVLKQVRKVIKPMGGIDLSAYAVVAVISFFSEFVTSSTGILAMYERNGGTIFPS